MCRASRCNPPGPSASSMREHGSQLSVPSSTHLADAESPALQRDQRQCRRRRRCGGAMPARDGFMPGQRRDRRQVFGLDQRDAALAAAAGVTVADQALAGLASTASSCAHLAHRARAAGRSIPPARRAAAGHQAAERGIGGRHGGHRGLRAEETCDASIAAMVPMPPPELPVETTPLPYEARLDARPRAQIDLVVIHCTELPDLATAREYGERVLYDSGTGNSGHYYIDRDGTVHLWVVARARRQPHARLQPAFDRHRTGEHRALSALARCGPPGDGRAVYRGADRCADRAAEGRLRRTSRRCKFITGHEDLDTTTVAAERRSDADGASQARSRAVVPVGPRAARGPPERVSSLDVEGHPVYTARHDSAPQPSSELIELLSARTPRGQPVPRPEPRHRHQVRVRRAGARAGAVGGAGDDGFGAGTAQRAFAACVLPARRRHRRTDRLSTSTAPATAAASRSAASPRSSTGSRSSSSPPRSSSAEDGRRASVVDAGSAEARGPRADAGPCRPNSWRKSAVEGAALAVAPGAVRVPPRLSARRTQSAEAPALPAGVVPAERDASATRRSCIARCSPTPPTSTCSAPRRSRTASATTSRTC